MELQKLEGLNKIFKFIVSIKRYSILVDIFLSIIACILVNQLKFVKEVDNTLIWLLIIITAIFGFFIKLFQWNYEQNLPVDLIKELKSGEEVKTLKKDIERQTLSKSYILSSINNLNDATCHYLPKDSFCNNNIKDGLNHLLKDFIRNTTSIIGISCTKYVVGVYLDSYYSNQEDGKTLNGYIILHDNLFEEDLENTLTYLDKGKEFDIQAEVFRSFNNNTYVENYIQNSHSIICVPIPDACNYCSDCKKAGVLFIIIETKLDFSNLPTDKNYTIDIFSRILGNWIARYNLCIKEKLEVRQQSNSITGGKVVAKAIVELKAI